MTAEEFARSVIDEHLCPDDPYVLGTELSGLGADSLDKVQLVLAFEDKMDIDVPDEEIDKLKTVGDVVEMVKRYATKNQFTEAGIGTGN